MAATTTRSAARHEHAPRLGRMLIPAGPGELVAAYPLTQDGPVYGWCVPDCDLPSIGAPATRALASIDVTRLNQLVDHGEEELLALHGLGPRALRLLKEALDSTGLSLRSADE